MRLFVLLPVLLALVCAPTGPRRAFAEDKKPAKGVAAEMAEGLTYPKAKRFDDSRGGPGIFQGKYTTPDAPSKVTAWYRKKLDFTGEGGADTGADELLVNPVREAEKGVRVSVQHTTLEPGKKPEELGSPRPVYQAVLVRRTNAAVIVIVVTKAKAEGLTYVTLTVMENKPE